MTFTVLLAMGASGARKPCSREGRWTSTYALRGFTPLIIGAQQGHSRIISVLVNNGADLSIVDVQGFSALHNSSYYGHLEASMVLVKAGADLTATTPDGFSPLHLAVQNRHLELLAALVKVGADLKATDSAGYTPLHLAAQNGYLEASTALERAGADLQGKPSEAPTPLQLAAFFGHFGVVKGLLTAGADLEATTCSGITALHKAAESGHWEVIAVLWKAGANLEASTCDGATPLHLASQNGVWKATATLVDAGADLNARDCEQGTPLHLAALKGHVESSTVLVNAGSDLQAKNSQGCTPLHMAVANGHLKTSKLLAIAGADLQATDRQGFTPLHLAEQNGHVGVMTALLEVGADPDPRLPSCGQTPLYSAASSGHLGAVSVLLRAKANPLLARTNPHSGQMVIPLDTAAQRGRTEVVRQLVQLLGVEGCGGASGGVEALSLAAAEQHGDIITILADAGVADDAGGALLAAAKAGAERAVKSLVQQKKRQKGAHRANYVNSSDSMNRTPLFCAIGFGRCSPRVVRLLLDTGADATSVFRVTNILGDAVVSSETPLETAKRCLRAKEIDGKTATEEQLHGLEGIRRLLLRVEAVSAVSWLWHDDVPLVDRARDSSKWESNTSTPLRVILSPLRRRATRRGVIFRALFRSVVRTRNTTFRGRWRACVAVHEANLYVLHLLVGQASSFCCSFHIISAFTTCSCFMLRACCRPVLRHRLDIPRDVLVRCSSEAI